MTGRLFTQPGGWLRRWGSSPLLAFQLSLLASQPALCASSQRRVRRLRWAGTSLDIDRPAERDASDHDPRRTGRPRPFVVVIEAADDPGAADVDIGVFGHHDGDVADDRGGVDGRLAVGEPGLAEVDLAVADHRQPAERAPHRPPAPALERGKDPGVSYRGGCRR